MALALLMAQYAQSNGVQVIALTVDHALRSESADEAKQVGIWLKAHGILHHILTWQGKKKPANIQANARKARYRLMADFCIANNINFLGVAHTSEDQAETVLMRIMRGSGIDGLAGINASKTMYGITIIRPLLNCSREQLRDYLRTQKQNWVNDPSNENNKFARVTARKFINTSGNPELLTRRLADTAAHMRRAKNYIEESIKKNIAGIITCHEFGFYSINVTKYKNLHSEERLRTLACILQHVGGQEYKPRFENLTRLDANICNNKLHKACTLWGCEIASGQKTSTKDIIYIYREFAAIAPCLPVHAGTNITWDNRFSCHIGDINIAGNSAPNLNIAALGAHGYQYILQLNPDFKFSAINLPKKVIYTLPALLLLEKPLAVPHIGYYCDEKLKIAFQAIITNPPSLFVI